jgi:asparagine synthase (glutamine-hydrolysing)
VCGFAGCLDLSRSTGEERLKQLVASMADRMLHRGPDSSGVWADEQCGVAFGHRRLAILDLSPEGNQPMISSRERYIITFNGEIYNYLEIREELERAGGAPPWRGHSDTEVLLAAFETWGVEESLRRAVGMFAFGLWDRQERTLVLARDRAGEKPLYYGRAGSWFLFGSDLAALRAHAAFRADLDEGALALFLRHNYIPAPHSVYRGIFKLLPGTVLRIDPEKIDAPFRPRYYWSFRERFEHALDNPFRGTEEEAVDQLDFLLRRSIRGQMLADVPVGAFLSGGIDSSLVVALMQAQSNKPVRTFTIGFKEEGYNEAHFAKAVARHLGTEHTELYVTPREAMEVVPRMPEIYTEPFADSSQIPTCLVARLARSHVTVALSGDAGDELFCGYTTYAHMRRLWGTLSRIPLPLREAAGFLLRGVARSGLKNLVPKNLAGRLDAPRLQKLAALTAAKTPEDAFRSLVSHTQNPERLCGCSEGASLLTSPSHWPRKGSLMERLMFLDFGMYLPDDILVKVDRAAMGVSLETRVPLLDHRIVEFAWSLPLTFKVRDGKGKHLLRKLLHRYVPKELVERPKKGFAVPVRRWLDADLAPLEKRALSRLRRDGIVSLPGRNDGGGAFEGATFEGATPKESLSPELRWGLVQLHQWLGE